MSVYFSPHPVHSGTDLPAPSHLHLMNNLQLFSHEGIHPSRQHIPSWHFHIPYPVLYHDMEKKLLIQFTEEKELQPIKKILDHANVGEDYTVRIVDNERDWIEKILISDSGYDDRIMELYKLLVLSQYEDADNVNALYYWNIQNFENPHYVMVLDEKESDKMHFMPFHEGVYKQVEEVFLSDIKQDYIVDASWAVSNTK